MPSLTCSKLYTDIPFAHRQHKHEGHCSLIHGHNWSFEFTFATDRPDECGFVIDFGKLQWLKEYLMQFDHALVLNMDDPYLETLHRLLIDMPATFSHPTKFAKIVTVPDCSCEGLAKHLFEQVGHLLHTRTAGRVWLAHVRVLEDSKNYATISA